MTSSESGRKLPGFTAETTLARARGTYAGRPSAPSHGQGVVPQVTVGHGCCPSGDCDTTVCTGDKWHLECNNGKANAVCDGCFLTSACTKARGLADDCEELTILRQFRDRHLLATPEGRELVADYYRIAPPICQAIEMLPDAVEVYEYLYRELVQPTVALVKKHDHAAARDLYRRVTLELQTCFSPERPLSST